MMMKYFWQLLLLVYVVFIHELELYVYSYRIKQIYARIIDQNGGKNRKIVTIFNL